MHFYQEPSLCGKCYIDTSTTSMIVIVINYILLHVTYFAFYTCPVCSCLGEPRDVGTVGYGILRGPDSAIPSLLCVNSSNFYMVPTSYRYLKNVQICLIKYV